MMKIIKFLLKLYLKKHPELLAYSIPVDDKTDIDIIVTRFYDDHWTRGTAIYNYQNRGGESEDNNNGNNT